MKCDAKFFGLRELPVIDISEETIKALAERSVRAGLTVPGVQKKLSLDLEGEGSKRLTLVDHPAGYILKPQTEEYEQLPENEDLVMDISEMMGVRTAPHGLIEVNGRYAYISKRVDRLGGKMYAMEDLCQLSGRSTADKYKGSYERCAKIIKEHSSLPGFDMSEYFLRLVVCFVTGNSDMHLKNFSLIEREPGAREFVLSPAYDLLSVNIALPADTEETALTLNGKKSGLRRKDFLVLAENMQLPGRTAERLIDSVMKKSEDALRLVDASELTTGLRTALKDLMRERCSRLG